MNPREALEQKHSEILSQRLGFPIRVKVISLTVFHYEFDGQDAQKAQRIRDFFSGQGTIHTLEGDDGYVECWKQSIFSHHI
jgi:hypothetical protein